MNALPGRGAAFERKREPARPGRSLAGGPPGGVPSSPFDDVAAPPLRRTGARPTDAKALEAILEMPPAGSIAAQQVLVLANPVDIVDATTAPVLQVSSREPTHTLQPLSNNTVTAWAQVGRATLFGLLSAVGIVALAVALRSEFEAPTPSVESRATAPVLPAVSAVDMSQAAVRLRFGMDLPTGRVAALQAALSAAGVGSVVLSPMPLPVERSRIEYFDASARPMAERLAQLIAPFTGSVAQIRDLASLAAKSDSRRLDLWIES